MLTMTLLLTCYLMRRHPRSTLFPYTTLFRSHTTARDLHTMPKRTVIVGDAVSEENEDRKSTRLNSSHVAISYAVFCLKKKIQLRPKDVKQSNSNMNSYEGPFQTTND